MIPVVSGNLRYELLTEKYLAQTIECMSYMWAAHSKAQRTISEYFPIARKVCEKALKDYIVVGFDINSDFIESIEDAQRTASEEAFRNNNNTMTTNHTSSDTNTNNNSSNIQLYNKPCLGCTDFLSEIQSCFSLLINKGDVLFHHYVDVLPGYKTGRTWRICLALALEIAKLKNFKKVVAVSSSCIEDQEVCEKLGFRKIGDIAYLYLLAFRLSFSRLPKISRPIILVSHMIFNYDKDTPQKPVAMDAIPVSCDCISRCPTIVEDRANGDTICSLCGLVLGPVLVEDYALLQQMRRGASINAETSNLGVDLTLKKIEYKLREFCITAEKQIDDVLCSLYKGENCALIKERALQLCRALYNMQLSQKKNENRQKHSAKTKIIVYSLLRTFEEYDVQFTIAHINPLMQTTIQLDTIIDYHKEVRGVLPKLN